MPVPSTADIQALYSRRRRSYVGYVQAFRHRQGLAAVLARSDALKPDMRALDAGCGSGLSILALVEALHRRRLDYRSIEAFDITPAMLDACRATLHDHAAHDVELRQADVLKLPEELPPSWNGYDLIVCASTLEYVRRLSLAASLSALADRLATDGTLIVLITRKLFYPTRWLWQCNGYTRRELHQACVQAGLNNVEFRYYPFTYGWLNIGNHVLEARR